MMMHETRRPRSWVLHKQDSLQLSRAGTYNILCLLRLAGSARNAGWQAEGSSASCPMHRVLVSVRAALSACHTPQIVFQASKRRSRADRSRSPNKTR